MKKIILSLFLFLTFVEVGHTYDLTGRRMNIVMVTQDHSENSRSKVEVLKGLSEYDFLQVQLHAGRLFIRDKIILE